MIEIRGFRCTGKSRKSRISYEQIGRGYVTTIVHGDVAYVRAVVDARIRAAEKVEEIVSSQVIPMTKCKC